MNHTVPVNRRLLSYSSVVAMLIFLVFSSPDNYRHFDHGKVILYLLASLFVLVIHSLSTYRKYFLLPSSIFLLGFALVHFSWPFAIGVLDYEPDKYHQLDSNYTQISRGTWLSAIALVAWVLGYGLSIQEKRSARLSAKASILQPLLIVNIALFVVFVLSVGRGYLSGGMFTGNMGDTGIGFYVLKLLQVTVLCLVYSLFYETKLAFGDDIRKHSIYKTHPSCCAFLGIYAAFFLFIGDRGPSIALVFATIFLYSSFYKKIGFLKFLSVSVPGAFLLALVGATRGGDMSFVENIGSLNFFDITAALGASARTLYMSLDYVPQHHDYFLGGLWAAPILAVVPKLQGVYGEITGVPNFMMSSPDFITYMRFGRNPPSGEGTTIVADIYLNFGVIGTFIVMYVLGVVFRRVDSSILNPSTYYAGLASLVFAAYALYLSRAPVFMALYQVIWAIFFVKLVSAWTLRKR